MEPVYVQQSAVEHSAFEHSSVEQSLVDRRFGAALNHIRSLLQRGRDGTYTDTNASLLTVLANIRSWMQRGRHCELEKLLSSLPEAHAPKSAFKKKVRREVRTALRENLQLAAANDHAATVCACLRWFKRHNATDAVEWKDKHRRCALWYACRSGSASAVAALLECKANAHLCSGRSSSALCVAARNRSSAVVQLLLDHKANYCNRRVVNAASNDWGVLKVLVRYKCSVNKLDKESGGTPLTTAIWQTRWGTCKALWRAKADLNMPDNTYEGTPLMTALRFCSDSRRAGQGSAGRSSSRHRMVHWLVHAKADVNARMTHIAFRPTALIYTLTHDCDDLCDNVRLLLDVKATVNFLHLPHLRIALERKEDAVVQMLINAIQNRLVIS